MFCSDVVFDKLSQMLSIIFEQTAKQDRRTTNSFSGQNWFRIVFRTSKMALTKLVPLAPWAAFVLGNLICCSFIFASMQVSWRLSLAVTVAYFVVTGGVAMNCEKERWHEGVRSLLWVLLCAQLGILGSWFSVALSPMDPYMDAASSDLSTKLEASHVIYGEELYFSSSRMLMRINSYFNLSTSVAPGVIDAHSFVEYEGLLYFFGKPLSEEGEFLWNVRSDGDASILQQFQLGSNLMNLNKSAETFSFEAQCGALQGKTSFSNETSEAEALLHLCSQLNAGMELRPPTGRLLGILLLGVLPQTILALYLLVRRKVPGVFLNVFLGVYALLFLIWILMEHQVANVYFFLQVTSMTYASASCLAVAVNQVLWSQSREFQVEVEAVNRFAADLATWAAAVTSIAFLASLHLILDIRAPSTWIIYGVLQLPQVVFAVLMRRMTPMAVFVIGFLVLLHKAIAGFFETEIAQAWPAELAKALQLAAFYVFGALAFLIFLCYKDKKKLIEELIHRKRVDDSTSAWEDSKNEEPLLEPEDDEESWLLLEQLPWQQLLQLQQQFGFGTREKAPDEEDC